MTKWKHTWEDNNMHIKRGGARPPPPPPPTIVDPKCSRRAAYIYIYSDVCTANINPLEQEGKMQCLLGPIPAREQDATLHL